MYLKQRNNQLGCSSVPLPQEVEEHDAGSEAPICEVTKLGLCYNADPSTLLQIASWPKSLPKIYFLSGSLGSY